jgi:hypothetical protein
MLRHTFEQDHSGNIEHAAYDPSTRKLHVTFRSGGTWEYPGVDEEHFHGLKGAESPGSYLHRQLKGRFGERKL